MGLFHPLLGKKSKDQLSFCQVWTGKNIPYLYEYNLFGYCFVAGATFIEMSLSAMMRITKNDHISLANMAIHKTMLVQPAHSLKVRLSVCMEKGLITIQSLLLDGTSINHVEIQYNNCPPSQVFNRQSFMALFSKKTADTESTIDNQYFYQKLAVNGVKYGENFKLLRSIILSSTKSVAKFILPNDYQQYTIHPCILYAAFQLMTLHLANLSVLSECIYLPVGIKHIEGYNSKGEPSELLITTELRPDGIHSCDIAIVDKKHSPILIINNFMFESMAPDEIMSRATKNIEKLRLEGLYNEKIDNVYHQLISLLDKIIQKNKFQQKEKLIHISTLIILWATRIISFRQ
jgi:hypothetical protein